MLLKLMCKFLCYLCIAIAFSYILYVYWHLMEWSFALGYVAFGALFFWFTFLKETKRAWIVKVALIAWSVHVYAVFVISGTINVHQHNIFPADTQDIGPLLYGLAPLIVLWGVRVVLAGIKEK